MPDIGGKIETLERDGGKKITLGPKTVLMKENTRLKELIHELQLEDKILYPQLTSNKKLISFKGELLSLPTHPLDFFKKPFRSMLVPLILEPFVPQKNEDESIEQFFLRRFGGKITNYLVDPMIKGIYGGGIDRLSTQEVFPMLKKWENLYGSVVKGAFKKKKGKREFFSFRGGLKDLVLALQDNSHLNLLLNKEIFKIERLDQGVRIYTNEQAKDFDHAFIATDLNGLQKLIPTFHDYFSMEDVSSITQVVVYFKKKYCLKAFGCLFPTAEKEDALGVLFDTAIFSNETEGTMLTVMIDKTEKEDSYYQDIALEVCQSKLKIKESPEFVLVKKYPWGIFLPKVGHQHNLQAFLNKIKEENPFISLLGSGLKGVSVADQIQNAYDTALEFAKKTNDCSFI